MSGWFGRRQQGQRRNARYVDYGRHLREQEERIPQVLWTLIGINVAVFVLWQLARGTPYLEELMTQHFLVSPEAIRDLRVWTLLTSEFSHLDLMHLAFNMFALWVFGQGAAEGIGWRGLLWLYGLGAVAASVGHVVLGLVTGDLRTPALGASGAVMAISVVYALLFPNRTILLNFFIPVPAWVAVTGFVVLDLVALGANDGVARAAHLGGAAMGAVYWWWTTQRSRGPRR